METESFALEMRDGVSSPSQAMAQSLVNLRSQMKLVGDQEDRLNRRTVDVGKSALVTTVSQNKLVSAEKEASKASAAEADALEAMGGYLVQVAKYSLAAAVALGALVLKGAELAAEAYTFRTRMSNVFEIYQGTAAQGQKTYEMIRAMSRTLPIPQEKAFESAQELLSLNLQGQNRLHNTVMSIGQMQAVMGDQAGGKLKSIITGAQESTMGGRFRGVFSVTPQDLKAIGLSYDQLTNILAKKIGQSNATTKQMLMYGRIDAATGIDAINEAVSKGAIGAHVKDALLAPDVLARQFSEHIRDLFKDVDMKPVLREVRNLVNMFDQGNQTGRTMKTGITATFNTIAKVAKEALIQVQLGILDLEYYGMRGAIAFAPMIKEIKRLGDNQFVMDLMAEGMHEFATGALMAAVAVGYTVYQVASMLNTIDSLRNRSKDMERLGLDLVAGLARGVATGAPIFEQAMKDLGDAGMKGIKQFFDAHSPSRKLRAFGRDDLAGAISLGMQDGGMLVGNGTIQVKSAGKPAGNAGGGVQVVVAPGAVQINGSGLGRDEMEDMVETAMADLAERIGDELGVVPT